MYVGVCRFRGEEEARGDFAVFQGCVIGVYGVDKVGGMVCAVALRDVYVEMEEISAIGCVAGMSGWTKRP